MSADGANPNTEPAPRNVVEMKLPDNPVPRAPEEKPRKNRRRFVIMAIVPALLLAGGGYFWLAGGRYASTDNAYVQQDRVTITADVSGRIVTVEARENDHVAAGAVLFRIDPEPYRIALAGAEAALASARLQVEQLNKGPYNAIGPAKAIL